MDLREYLFRERMKINAFAKKINYDQSYISNVCSGKIKPGQKLATLIQEATNGQVVYEVTEPVKCEACMKLKIEKQQQKKQQACAV